MDEILNLIESVSEGFPSYFFIYLQIQATKDIFVFLANSFKAIFVTNSYNCVRIVQEICFESDDRTVESVLMGTVFAI